LPNTKETDRKLKKQTDNEPKRSNYFNYLSHWMAIKLRIASAAKARIPLGGAPLSNPKPPPKAGFHGPATPTP
jgi:hypothetical protein